MLENRKAQITMDPPLCLCNQQTCCVINRTCVDRAVVVLHLECRLTVLTKLQTLAAMCTAVDRFERRIERASHLSIRFQHRIRCEFNDHGVILQQMSDTVVFARS